MDSSNTYTIKVCCSNCDLRRTIEIPKGKKIDEMACPNCGTKELDKDVEINLGNDYN